MTTNFTADNVPDQTGKTFFVTGANTGIGFEAARAIAEKGGRVLLGSRNPEKGRDALARIVGAHPDVDVTLVEIDLADLASVRSAAEIVGRESRLDVLVNNAGVMMCPYSMTVDGFEIQMGTNHLGHFALTGLLMPLMKSTEGSRIVTISSMAHAMGDIDLADLAWEKRVYKTRRAYSDSKLANLYFTYELARRLRAHGDHPLAIAAHPGWTATDLQRHSGLFQFLNRFLAMSAEMGALPTLRAAFDHEAMPGQFYGPEGRLHMRGYPVAHEPNARSQDETIARRLWDLSEEMTGVSF